MKRTIRVLLVLLVAAALFLAGLVVGSRRMGAILFTALEHEVAGSLFASVESLASLRLGEPGAVEGQLEGRLQNAVISLPQQRSWEEHPEVTRRALVLAKAYLERHPPEAPNSGLEAVLAEIPDQALDLESQSPFVRRLLSEPRAGVEGQGGA